MERERESMVPVCIIQYPSTVGLSRYR